MTRFIICLLLVAAGVGAGDLSARIRDYETARKKVGALRSKKRQLRKHIKEHVRPALDALGEERSPATLDYLEGELQHPVPELVAEVVRIVGSFDSKRSARLLVEAVRADDAGGINAAILKALSATESPEARKWLGGPAFKSARRPEQMRVVSLVAGKLRLESAAKALVKLLGHRDPVVSHGAIEGLADLGFEGRIRKLRRFPFDDLALPLRVKVMDSLVVTGGEPGLELVLERAREGDPETRAIALGSAALRPESEDAFMTVRDSLFATELRVVTAAMKSFRAFRFVAMVPVLFDALDQLPTERLRIDALELLVRLTGQNMGFVTADWRNWWVAAEEGFSFARNAGSTSVTAHDLKYFGIEVASKRMTFVVDASLSMRQPLVRKAPEGSPESRRKLDVMKEELIRILEALPDAAYINIIPFDADFRPWKKRLHSLKGKGRREAIEFVREMPMEYGTNIYDTLEFALQDPDVDTIYLLTDGAPLGGKFSKPVDIRREIGALNRVRGARIHCIAFGKQTGFLEKLAEENDGDYCVFPPEEEKKNKKKKKDGAED